jgi:SAM-dependent methyltransferase
MNEEISMNAINVAAPAIDLDRRDRFMDAALNDLKGAIVLMMANLGDRLGLFKALAERPMSSDELAGHLDLQERYVREWLSGMTCAGYLECDVATHTFTLPEEHALVLATDASPFFLGGAYQEMPTMWRLLDKLETVFEVGGGLSLEDYDRDWWDGMERFTGTWFENFLLQDWIAKADKVQAQLEQGVHVADVGCGRGRALVKLAKAFPNMTGVGYDLSETNLAGARQLANDEGVADRIRFEKRDVHDGLAGSFGLITSFDSMHDLRDPSAVFKAVHAALDEGGSFLVLEFKVAERLEDNIGTIGAMLYGWSLAYCMTTSLGMGGVGLGTCGLPEKTIRIFAQAAGFASVATVPFNNPFNVVYQLTK